MTTVTDSEPAVMPGIATRGCLRGRTVARHSRLGPGFARGPDRAARSIANPRTACDRTKSATTLSLSMSRVDEGVLNNETNWRQ